MGGSSRGGAGAVLLAASVLAACRQPPAPLIRVGHESDVISLDPTAHQEAATHSILSNVFEPLVDFDKDMHLVPALAVAWSALDGRTWLIHLRRGVRLHDGRTLTAANVKFALERARGHPASAVKGHLSVVEDVRVVDQATVELKTRRPEPLLMNRLTYVLIVPGPEHPDLLTRPVGTGPYKVVAWEQGRVLEAESFAGYWGGKAPIDRARFVPVEEGEKSVLALRRGEVDVLRWVPETLAGQVREVPGIRVASREGLSSYYLWFNSAQGKGAPRNPFAERRVRQAISLAIDRPELIRRLGGTGVPANQLVQKGVFGYVAGLPELPVDRGRARRLLREAGYARGLDATLVHRSQESVHTVAASLQAMLGEVGIRVGLETPEWPVALARWRAGETPFFLAGWRFEDGDATSFLRDCLFTREPTRNYGGFNPGYSNPELDRLIEENSQIFGEDKRLKHYETLMRLAMEELPIVPLHHRYNLYGVSEKVRWEPRLDGRLLVSEMSFR